jgi:RHS repeat-associated protein
VYQANRGSGYQLVAQYEYNELGQLVDKKLHHTGGSNFLQSVDYRYTIRGQLKSINNSELAGNSSNDDPDSDQDDYFGMELLYTETEAGLTTDTRYDGSISAMKWKSAGAESGSAGQKSYAFAYDKTGRLETASYAKKESSWNKEVGAQNEAMTYDHNGNILTLQRKQRKYDDLTASYTNETIDNLTYAYTSTNKNSLEKVTDAASTSAAAGFDNGSSTTSNDYTYDINGNLLSDKNKGIDSIKYNFLGKPVRMKFSDGKVITYVYDAGGNKLTQKLYNGATLVTTTEYVNGFVYEKAGAGATTLSFFGSPEGRVVNNSGTLQYEYSIADHQGNTRVVFTSATPTITSPETNFENNSAGFLNFPSGGTLNGLEVFDHTDAGTTNSKSTILNGGYNSQVGVTKSFKVYPGDKVKAEAYAKYQNASSSASNLSSFALMLTGAFGVTSSSTGEALKAYNTLNSYGGEVAAGTGHGSEPGDPKAFVTILLFDKNYNLLDAAWDQIDADYEQGSNLTVKDPFDYLTKEVTVKEEGFAYVFISNESPTFVDVYFDDVKFTHTPTNVIQYNEFYPFGLQTSTSWTRESTKENQFLYNAGSELNKTNSWYEMYYRGYDPAIGRMLQVDPYATMYASTTTYNYALNNPVMMNDPSGGQSQAPPGVSQMGWERYGKINSMDDPNYISMWSESIGQGQGWDYLSGGSRESDGHLVGTPRAIRDKNGNIVGYKFSGAAAQFVFGMWKKGLDQGFITTKDGNVAIMRFDNRPRLSAPVFYASKNGGLYGVGGNVYWKSNPTMTMNKQLFAMCTFAAMAYANNEFGGTKTAAELAKYYIKTFNSPNALLNGADFANMPDFASAFFTFDFNATSLQDQIDSGHPILSAIFEGVDQVSKENVGHTVLIIGYNSNSGHMIYMDPLLGKTATAPQTDFGYFFTYPLTGNK